MKFSLYAKSFLLLSYICFLSLPITAYGDATDGGSDTDGEGEITIEYFNNGDSKSSIGDATVSTSGVMLETEYEVKHMTFSFNYERWNYDWTNPASLPFSSGSDVAPWSTFNTIQLGFDYEQEINDQWELNYYIEAESSFEKETSKSNEYELGVDFSYELSDSWTFTFNVNLEYLDATGAEVGADVEIEWNHDKKEGWSGEFELSSEFPETSVTYHFTKAFSSTVFFNEGGTSLIRLSDSSPVPGMQGGYLEDEYNSIGFQVDYELRRGDYLSFTLQKNFNRSMSLQNNIDLIENNYNFGDSVGASIQYKYTF
ncbi:MAG: hypothetical protein L3J83_03130 [Proteobacteria bacterium]|nr:hypothetical protein [Pseudomonadota bacterium]